MEKIYTQGQGQKQKQQQMNFSVILSFTLAILSIFTIGTFAIVNNQGGVSYAAPTDNTFKMIIPDGEVDVTSLMGIGDDGEWFNVPLYYAGSIDGANRVYCVEMRKDGGDTIIYTKSEAAKDPGLLYILNNSFASGKRITGVTGEDADYAEVWATQSAIWLYLAEKRDPQNQFYNKGENPYPKQNPTASLGTKKALETTKQIQYLGGSRSGDKFDTPGIYSKVRALVDAATNAKEEAITLSVSAANENIVKTSDGKYYQTSVITVAGTPANALKTYDITSVSGIDGVKVVDENGAEMALTNIPAGKKFYLRIPANKVTNKAATLRVNVTGNFSTYVYYVADGYQKVVAPGNHQEQRGIDFEITGSPDTGMNAAQTIYFIGLIVLLCGVGIVYANAKPVESKQ